MANFDILEFVDCSTPRGRHMYIDDDGNQVLSYDFSESMIEELHEFAIKILFEHLDLNLNDRHDVLKDAYPDCTKSYGYKKAVERAIEWLTLNDSSTKSKDLLIREFYKFMYS